MGKPYTPTVASSYTGSPVGKGLAGGNPMQPNPVMPMHNYGAGNQPSGNKHVGTDFTKPMHNYAGGAMGHHQNLEVRTGGPKGVPHIPMVP